MPFYFSVLSLIMVATRRQSEKQQSDLNNSKTKKDDAFDSANGGDMVDSMSESESEGSDWEHKPPRQFFYEFINLVSLT